jgi:hypothetical protein
MNESTHPKITSGQSLEIKRIVAKRNLKELQQSIGLVILHIPLGVILYQSSFLAYIYPLFIFLLGVYWAYDKRVKIEKVAFVCAYLVGAEVLWRMAESAIFWEFGKYSIVLIMIIALIQRGYMKSPMFPFLYFTFLIPACIVTFVNNSLSDTRGKLSFNLSGPLALFVCCWFFSYVRVNSYQLKKILLTLILPIISIGIVTLFYTVTTPDIQFNNESNFELSGGYGPNQVSSVLGLGAFICLACLLIFKNDLKTNIFIGFFAVFFSAQSIMTFSRGGMYSAVGAALAVTLFQLQNLTKTVKRIIPIIGLGLIFLVFIFPYMNDFTGGKLQERYEDRGTTSRFDIVESDLILFMQHPILGTGVGQSKRSREEILGFSAASHTEFSRIISEHGIFGVLSLIALGLTVVYNLKRQRLTSNKAFVVGVICWSGLFMLNTGMRLASPAFLWGISFAVILGPQLRRIPKFGRKTVIPKPGPSNKTVDI